MRSTRSYSTTSRRRCAGNGRQYRYFDQGMGDSAVDVQGSASGKQRGSSVIWIMGRGMFLIKRIGEWIHTAHFESLSKLKKTELRKIVEDCESIWHRHMDNIFRFGREPHCWVDQGPQAYLALPARIAGSYALDIAHRTWEGTRREKRITLEKCLEWYDQVHTQRCQVLWACAVSDAVIASLAPVTEVL
jgi:hypothetical protein